MRTDRASSYCTQWGPMANEHTAVAVTAGAVHVAVSALLLCSSNDSMKGM